MKSKLSTKNDSSAPGSAGSPSSGAPPLPTPGGFGGGFKIKLKSSAPPTPASEFAPSAPAQSLPLAPPPTKPKRPYNRKPKPEDGSKPSKKRAADSDISPPAKRISDAPSRRISSKIGPQSAGAVVDHNGGLTTPGGGPRSVLNKRKQSSGPKNLISTTKKRPPPRPVGVGYDSEASDAEADPAIEQQFISRMAPGDDCDYSRTAIAEKRLGSRPEEGGADVSMRFLDKDYRRAMVTVKGRRYAAAMVDSPCIIEGMKSWDKRGWWKVADICQMSLVSGPCADEAEAKHFPSPREVDKDTWAYAHGLTPPMHWVRKRRFRKRVSYRTIEHVEEEVEKSLREDAEAEKQGGTVRFEIVDKAAEGEEYDEDEGEEGYMETTENGYGEAEDVDFDDMDDELGAELAAALEDGEDIALDESEINMPNADAAASLGAVLSVETPSSATNPPDTSAVGTPAEYNASGTASSDEDEDDYDEDGPDALDEDLLAEQAESAQKREESADLEREVANAKQNAERQMNPSLKNRMMTRVKDSEQELEMRRKAMGLDD